MRSEATQLEERFGDIEEVASSSLASPTIFTLYIQ
jgi:hypothetical protein